MEKYKIIKQLGDGTYGSVLLAQIVAQPQEKVAIKRFVTNVKDLSFSVIYIPFFILF